MQQVAAVILSLEDTVPAILPPPVGDVLLVAWRKALSQPEVRA